MKNKSTDEIRLRNGKCDDIVFDKVDLHLEDMDGKLWWLGLYEEVKDKRRKNGKRYIRTTFHISSKTTIKVEVVENELRAKFVEQEK